MPTGAHQNGNGGKKRAVIILRSSVITRKLKRMTRSAFHNPAAEVFVCRHTLLFWKLWLRGCTRLARKAVYPPSRQVGVIDFVTKSWWNMSTGATGDQRNSSCEAFIGLPSQDRRVLDKNQDRFCRENAKMSSKIVRIRVKVNDAIVDYYRLYFLELPQNNKGALNAINAPTETKMKTWPLIRHVTQNSRRSFYVTREILLNLPSQTFRVHISGSVLSL